MDFKWFVYYVKRYTPLIVTVYELGGQTLEALLVNWQCWTALLVN